MVKWYTNKIRSQAIISHGLNQAWIRHTIIDLSPDHQIVDLIIKLSHTSASSRSRFHQTPLPPHKALLKVRTHDSAPRTKFSIVRCSLPFCFLADWVLKQMPHTRGTMLVVPVGTGSWYQHATPIYCGAICRHATRCRRPGAVDRIPEPCASAHLFLLC